MKASREHLEEGLSRLSRVRLYNVEAARRKENEGHLRAAKEEVRAARDLIAAEEEPEQPPPPPAPGGPVIALNVGAYGGDAADIAACVPAIRYETSRGTGSLRQFHAAGLLTNLDFSGPYSGGGVKSIDRGRWVEDCLAFYRANTTPSQSPWLEVLNEASGSWFWGPNADSAENALAYGRLIDAVRIAFRSEYGDKAPAILGYVQRYGVEWGKRWLEHGSCDGVTVHPYGGTGQRAYSALGNRAVVEAAAQEFGLPVYITEVGWPTATGQNPTGDSLQWSEPDQAANIVNFIEWCRTKPYVAQVVVFQWRDYDVNMWYGVTRRDGSKKPSYGALKNVV